MAADLQGRALWDYYTRGRNALYMHTSYAPRHKMPLEAFFKDPESDPLEKTALDACRGSVLDVGAGAGRFALALQLRNREVSALEISPLACQLMRQRGVRQVIQGSFWEEAGQFDTLLLMMNGLGLAGTLADLPRFFTQLKRLLKPGGQVILDSSDLEYLYDADNPKPSQGYYGEMRYCYEYRGTRGTPFHWLFLDYYTLTAEANKAGFITDLLYGPANNQFLVRLRLY